jgi:hypothetical protein
LDRDFANGRVVVCVERATLFVDELELYTG